MLGLAKDIGAQMSGRHLATRRAFNSRPPLRLQESLVGQPVGDGLLADGRLLLVGPTEEHAHSARELGLGSGDDDRSLEGGDVGGWVNGWLAHELRAYKCTCNYVNKYAWETPHKETCTVGAMTASPKKAAQRRVPKKAATIKGPFPKGPDGKSANERLKDLLGDRGQTWLARACNTLLGPRQNGEPAVNPRNIERFINNRDDFSRSYLIPAVAEVFGVRALWLQTGQLPRANDAEQAVRQLVEQFSSRTPEQPPPKRQ